MDQKLCEKEKQLNSLGEQRQRRERRIKELQTSMARLDLLATNSDTNYAQYDLKVGLFNTRFIGIDACSRSP